MFSALSTDPVGPVDRLVRSPRGEETAPQSPSQRLRLCVMGLTALACDRRNLALAWERNIGRWRMVIKNKNVNCNLFAGRITEKRGRFFLHEIDEGFVKK